MIHLADEAVAPDLQRFVTANHPGHKAQIDDLAALDRSGPRPLDPHGPDPAP